MKVQAGRTSSEYTSVPGPNFVQSAPVPKTECVSECKMNLHPAVEGKVHMHANKHANTSGKHQMSFPQDNLFRPLFPVGSCILARKPWNQQGQLQNRCQMRVEQALGHYAFILSDGKQWSVQQLIRVKGPVNRNKGQ